MYSVSMKVNIWKHALVVFFFFSLIVVIKSLVYARNFHAHNSALTFSYWKQPLKSHTEVTAQHLLQDYLARE